MQVDRGREALEVFYFVNAVPDAGYRFDDNLVVEEHAVKPKGRPPFLVQKRGRRTAKSYNPLKEYPLLFTKFSELDGSQASILKFANEYGNLGVGDPVYNPRKAKAVLRHGEGLNTWQTEIKELKELFELSVLARFGDEETLKDMIIWKEGAEGTNAAGIMRVMYQGARKRSLIADSSRRWPQFFETLRRDDVIRPAMFYLAEQVNRKLKENASPVLALGQDSRLEMLVVPHNLLAAMWLQLEQVIAGDKRVIQCNICHRWMDATGSLPTKRMHTRCSKRMRMRRLRAKEKE